MQNRYNELSTNEQIAIDLLVNTMAANRGLLDIDSTLRDLEILRATLQDRCLLQSYCNDHSLPRY